MKNSIQKYKVNNTLCYILLIALPFSWVSLPVVGSAYRLISIGCIVLCIINNKLKIYIGSQNRTYYISWLLYCAYMIVSSFWITDGKTSITLNIFSIALLVGISIVFCNGAFDENSVKIIETLFIIDSLILVILFFFGKVKVFGYSERKSLILLGTETDPNEFSGYFAISIVVMLKKINSDKEKIITRVLIIVLLIASFIVVLMTGSRGALLATVLCSVLYMIQSFSRRKTMFYIVLGAIGIVSWTYFILPILPDAIITRFSLAFLDQDGGSGRFQIWENSLKMFFGGDFFRMLFGYGYGRISTDTLASALLAHNNFIQNLVSYGFVGFSLFLFWEIRAFRLFNRSFKDFMFSFLGIQLLSISLTMVYSYKIFWVIMFIPLMNVQKKEGTNNAIQYNSPGL